ncbi:MAG: DNA polymerase IV [Thermoleophilaceae bacterium]
MAERRVIAHMDCDAFYASVELMRRPELVGRPVVVAGAGPRAVVTTASYEARRFGIGSAMAASRARRLCPQAVFIPPDFGAYRSKSQEVWELVRERLGCPLQQVSLDEAYADITHLERPIALMRTVVEETRAQTGITLSVGIAPSRLVAKTASDARKPTGFVVLSREQACDLFAAASPRLLQGVGPKTVDRLLRMGIADIRALQKAPDEELCAHFGERMGLFLKARANFHDDSPVVTERIAKSRSSERTFDEDVSDPVALAETTRRLALEVCDSLALRGVRGRTIAIKVRLDDWTNVTRARTIGSYTNDAGVVGDVALELLNQYSPPRPVRLLGVRVGAFEGSAEGGGMFQRAPIANQLALEL